jgi:hypothetical protein
MTYADNIVDQWNAASAADLATGLDWYERARTFARSLGLADETGAGVVAALSPMNGWSANMTLARGLTERYLAGEAMPTSGFGLRGNVLKAWRILDGQDPLDVLRGQKVTAFYANIMGDPNAVTVERGPSSRRTSRQKRRVSEFRHPALLHRRLSLPFNAGPTERDAMTTEFVTEYRLYVPENNNAGYDVDYVEDVRRELTHLGVEGWTEYRTTGVWHGQREPVTVFEVLTGDFSLTDSKLVAMLRETMPDQDAVLVTARTVEQLLN